MEARIPPATREPTARATISGWMRRRLERYPARPPAAAATATMAASARTNGQRHLPDSSMVMLAPATTQLATERSMPPTRTTRVCPAAATPRIAASTSMAEIELGLANPSMVSAPKANRATSAASSNSGYRV